MSLKLLSILLLSTLISTKILVMDYSDLPKLLNSLADSGNSPKSRHFAENEEALPFKPLLCSYAGEFRPGFEFEDKSSMMKPSQLVDCRSPTEYEVAKEVELNGEEDLSDCAGISYVYKKNGEEIQDTLYVARTTGKGEGLPEVHPGYYSKRNNRGKVFMYGAAYVHRDWMGNLVVLCKKE